MKINWLNSFAAGILLATSICGVVYFTDDNQVSKAATKPKTVELSEKEMKEMLSGQGYVIQTKEEYDNNLATAKKAASTPEKKPAATEQAAPAKDKTRLIINVTDGMTSIDVGKMLVAGKLVPNAYNFSQDIEKKGLQNKLKPGIYTVDDSMSYDQIISAIFH